MQVAGDDTDMALFRPLLARTSLEKRGLKLAYDANRDGWDARCLGSSRLESHVSVFVCLPSLFVSMLYVLEYDCRVQDAACMLLDLGY